MFSENTTPLQHTWTWAFKPTIVYKQQTAEDWMADFRPVIPQPFSTVEQFWAIYNNMHPLHELDYGNIYAVFRDNIQPVWEHPNNENGYSIVLYANKSNTNDYNGRLYQNSLLALIGNGASFSKTLNGCTLERKTGGNKIVFWMGETPATNTEKLETVKQILQFINVPRSETTLCDANARVDWRDPKFVNFKLVISCRSHKARVNEQPIATPRKTTNGTTGGNRASGASGASGTNGTSGTSGATGANGTSGTSRPNGIRSVKSQRPRQNNHSRNEYDQYNH